MSGNSGNYKLTFLFSSSNKLVVFTKMLYYILLSFYHVVYNEVIEYIKERTLPTLELYAYRLWSRTGIIDTDGTIIGLIKLFYSILSLFYYIAYINVITYMVVITLPVIEPYVNQLLDHAEVIDDSATVVNILLNFYATEF